LNRLIQILCMILSNLIWLASATAQETEKSYLENLLESSLSSPGMQVSVTGLKGALSSSAKIEKIDFSDTTGVWLTIENAELNWTRSALLRKRIKAEMLSADKITIFRKPAPNTQSTAPAAGTFRVPELPVSVNIQNISAKEFVLEEPVFGLATRLQLAGNIDIANGNLNVSLTAQNLDNEGIFELKTTLHADGKAVFIHLKAEEAANGVIANILDIPDKPSVSATIDGQGTYTALITDVHVKTNGSDRLNGQVIIAPNVVDEKADGVQVAVDLAGDLAPFFKSKYQDFFGKSNKLKAVAKLPESGEIFISGLDLQTDALAVKGALALAADHTPTRINLVSRLKNKNETPVLLPLKGPEAYIQSAKLTIRYDVNEPWFGALNIWGFTRNGLSVENIQLNSSGENSDTFSESSTSDLPLTAYFDAAATSISHTNPDLDGAVGEDVLASGKVTYSKGEPVIISGLTLSDGNILAGFDGKIAGLDSALETTGKLYAQIADLSVISGILGQNVQGKTTLDANGSVALLSGAFDLDIEATGSSLSLGDSVINPLIKGENSAVVSMARTQDGLSIDKLIVSNPQLSINANGRMQNDQKNADLAVTLNDMVNISETLSGPLTADGTIKQNGDDLIVDFETTGADGLRADINGTVPINNGDWDLTVKGKVPLAIADIILANSSTRARGDAMFDLTMNGQPSLNNVSGNISTVSANVALPALLLSIEDIKTSISLANGISTTRLSANLSTGGQISGEGQITLNQQQGFPADLRLQLNDITQEDPLTYKTTINGDIALSGPLLSGPTLSGQIDLTDTEINIKGAGNQNVGFIPEIAHKNEPPASLLTRKRAGLVITEKKASAQTRPIILDLLISAPSHIFVRGRGLDAELGGEVRLTGTTQAVAPIGSIDLIRGRLVILGKQLSITEGSISMAGTLDPTIRFVATNNSGGYETSAIISGLVSDPQFSFESSPKLPENEILAHMLFGSGLDEISPFQALQLASALRELTGSGGPQVGGRLRSKLSLDDLSVEAGEDGKAGLRAGRYISEKVYTDVTIMGDGKSEISINLDLNKNLSTRGAVSESGGTKFGIIYKKDY
jgi:translocation and assembly module TamB